jgi:hypothetical protein
MPGAAGIGACIEGERGAVAQFGGATQQRSTNFIPRPNRECLTIQVGVPTNSCEPSAGASESSSLQSPVRVPLFREICKLE